MGVFVLAVSFLIIIGSSFCLYRFIFCHPIKHRPDAHHIPDSNLYRNYRDKMSDVVRNMEEMDYEEVSILSTEGYRLYGKLYNFQKNAPLLIFFHGYHGVSGWDGYGFFKICRNNKINLLMIDERAHGKSEGNVITFGIKERYDCKLWTDYAVERFGKNTDIILAGVSMGAASVIMSCELGLPENVRAMVADCGYSEPAAIIKETIRNMKLPVAPIYWLVNLGAHLFGHFALDETTVLKAVSTLQIPVLFIHGGLDSIVPLSMNDEIYERCTGKKERIVIEGADHANSAMTDYEAYEEAVMGFLDGVLFGA